MNETKSESVPLSRDVTQAVRGVGHCKGKASPPLACFIKALQAVHARTHPAATLSPRPKPEGAA